MPKRTPGEVLRALFIAARMTLRGQPHPAEAARARYPKLSAWMEEAGAALGAVEQTALRDALDPAAFRLHIEGRDVSLRALIDGVRYHLHTEYPSLLASGNPYARLALKATNLNDHYAAHRMAESDALPAGTRAALQQLGEILARLPAEEA